MTKEKGWYVRGGRGGTVDTGGLAGRSGSARKALG